MLNALLKFDLWRVFTGLVDWALNLGVWLTRIGWRYRAGLTPIYGGLTVLVAGTVLHAYAPGWWWAPLVAGALGGAALFWLGERLSGSAQRALSRLIPDWADEGRKGVLDRRSERGYLAVLIVVTAGWLAWLCGNGLDEPTWWALVGTVAASGIPWWWHRGFRRRRRPNRWSMRWPHVGEAIKEFEGSKVIGTQGDKKVTELKVVLRPGLTVNHVGDRALQVASALSPRLRPGAVTLADGGAARRVTVRIVPRDPWQGVIPHPLPEFGTVDLSRNDRVMIGRLEDGKPLLHKMRQHTLVVAQSGGGKSVMGDALIAWMVLSRSPIAAIDMASGVSLDVWEPCMAVPLATTMEQAMALLRGVMNVVEYREQEMRKLRVKVWPGEDLFVPIDEFPTLVRAGGKQMIALLTVLGERARKTGVWLYFLSQNPTKEDLGSTELRGQMMCTLGGRLDDHMSKILWADGTKRGWDGTALQRGTWLLKDDTRNVPRVAKGVWLQENEQSRLVREVSHAGGVPLSPGSLRALRGDMSSGGTTLVGQRPVTVDVAEQHQPQRVTILESARSPLDELDARILEELPSAEQATVSPAALVEQTGASRDQVKRSLARLAKRGQAVSPKHGQWARTA